MHHQQMPNEIKEWYNTVDDTAAFTLPPPKTCNGTETDSEESDKTYCRGLLHAPQLSPHIFPHLTPLRLKRLSLKWVRDRSTMKSYTTENKTMELSLILFIPCVKKTPHASDRYDSNQCNVAALTPMVFNLCSETLWSVVLNAKM